jgi:hypothetical protein
MGCVASKPEITDIRPGGMFIHLPKNKPEVGNFSGNERTKYMVIFAEGPLGDVFKEQLYNVSRPIGLVTKSGELVMPVSWSYKAHSLRQDLQEDISDEVFPGLRMENKQKQLAALMNKLTAKQQELPNLLKVVYLN